MRVVLENNGAATSDLNRFFHSSSSMNTSDVLPAYQEQRELALANLINRFYVQLLHGCGSPNCHTSACRTLKSRVLGPRARAVTSLTARAMAAEFATSKHPESHLCPYITDVQTAQVSVEPQLKTDPKSVVQQLFNTESFRSFQAIGTKSSKAAPLALHSDEQDDETTHKDTKGAMPKSANRKQSAERTWLTCDEIIALKRRVLDLQVIQRLDRLQGNHLSGDNRQATLDEVRELLTDLSNPTCIRRLVSDEALDVWSDRSHYETPTTCLDQAFRGWPTLVHALLFGSLSVALQSIPDGPFHKPRGETPETLSFVSRAENEHSGALADVAIVAIHCLTASIPRAQVETWRVVWSALIHGRAYGKQRRRKTDISISPWLHMLDAFESEPALRLAEHLIRAIAAAARSDENHNQSQGLATDVQPNSEHSGRSQTRVFLIRLLINEERKIRLAEFGTEFQDKEPNSSYMIGTTTLVWLEWLRKTFLKNWDGGYRLERHSVPGMALELMEDLWQHKGRDELDVADELFLTSPIFSELNIDKAAVDWVDYEPDPYTRHILSFRFLFSTRSSTLLFRVVNHVLMRRAYCGAGEKLKLRDKAIPRRLYRDAAYLDRLMKPSADPYLVLKIRRDSVLPDAYDQLWHRLEGELAKPLRVRMGMDEGEIGHDLGGVQIEFFNLACREALNPDYSLFSLDPITRLAWFQPASMVPLYKYQLFGTLFGLALHNGVTLPVSFPFALYRKLLSQPCDELDLLEGWPDLAKSLEYLRNYDGSVEDDLMRDYVFTFVANGLHVETSMEDPWGESSSPRGTVPMQTNTPGMLKILGIYPDKHHPQTSPTPEARNGASTLGNSDAASTSDGAASYLSTDPQTFNWPGWITDVASDTPVPVTNSNREEYVRDYTQWVLDYSVRPQFQAFAQGCHNVMDPKALSLLTPEALRTIIEGYKHLDVNLLQRAATYRGYEPNSQVIRWFWEVVHNYSEEKQKQLLEFVTASSRIPVNGAEALTFVIERSTGDTDQLPGSSTCFSTLRLPEYESKEVLQSKLGIALEHSLGFGQA